MPCGSREPQAYRLRECERRAGVAELCAAARHRLRVRATGPRRASACGVVAMDMDSTLITIECIDEIADMARASSAQVAAITAAAMRGEIDFAQSLDPARRAARRAAVGALAARLRRAAAISRRAPSACSTASRRSARRRCSSRAASRSSPIACKARLGLDATAANTLEIADGTPDRSRRAAPIVDARGQGGALAALREHVADADGIAVAIGDGANDLPMLEVADISIAYRAKPIVRAQATYRDRPLRARRGAQPFR